MFFGAAAAPCGAGAWRGWPGPGRGPRLGLPAAQGGAPLQPGALDLDLSYISRQGIFFLVKGTTKERNLVVKLQAMPPRRARCGPRDAISTVSRNVGGGRRRCEISRPERPPGGPHHRPRGHTALQKTPSRRKAPRSLNPCFERHLLVGGSNSGRWGFRRRLSPLFSTTLPRHSPIPPTGNPHGVCVNIQAWLN